MRVNATHLEGRLSACVTISAQYSSIRVLSDLLVSYGREASVYQVQGNMVMDRLLEGGALRQYTISVGRLGRDIFQFLRQRLGQVNAYQTVLDDCRSVNCTVGTITISRRVLQNVNFLGNGR